MDSNINPNAQPYLNHWLQNEVSPLASNTVSTGMMALNGYPLVSYNGFNLLPLVRSSSDLESGAGNFLGNNMPVYYEGSAIPSANNISNSYSILVPGERVLPNIEQEQMIGQLSDYLFQLKSRGEYLVERGDFVNAIKYFENIIAYHSEDSQVWIKLGYCYLLINELPKAFGAYQMAFRYQSGGYDPSLWHEIRTLYDKVKVNIILA